MRLLVVSNRLPITVVEEEGRLRFQQSVGGLVSGLSAYLDSLKGSSFVRSEYMWVGWPGITVKSKAKEELAERALSKLQAYPVFLSEKIMEKFYHGFCNKTIWPLFHYFPSYSVYNPDYWTNYKDVNEIFCNAVMETIKPDDIVWVHDYHLMLLPKLLRERMPEVPIGFFLHIPFPSYEIFRLLPRKWRIDILNGILGADLIGFHTHDYTQYFLRCVLRILGYEHDLGRVIVGERIVKVDTFPMGVDFKRFYDGASSPEVQKERDELKTLADSKIILSIDRLDYTKGIINRLQSFDLFLEKNPQWHRKVNLILIVVPSRIGVEHYEQMKNRIDELVGRINGRFSSIGWTPILYQYRFLPFHPLVALYAISDVALVTPLRDGMNLIAKEYIAARADKTGVLILSEMAGASKELGEAIIINPNNIEEITEALKEALEVSQDEQIRRNQVMQNRLQDYDVIRWAEDFIQGLLSIKKEQERFNVKLLNASIKKQLLKDFIKSERRLIFLDYYGTLVPFAEHPEMSRPDEELLKLLRCISEKPNTDVILISEHDKNTLQTWFGTLNIGLVAEDGVWIKEKMGDWQLIKPLTAGWILQLLPILKMYADRLPGSFVEEKEFSIVWHYRSSDHELASVRVKELIDNLIHFTANIDIQILQGSKAVEIKNAGVNKATAGMYFLSKGSFDFILAVGDDWTDEDLFRVLPQTAYSVKVGISPSYAKFNLRSYVEVRKFFEEIVKGFPK
jgi:trehalose 6-phosphate synthase/phosphatase